MAISLSRMPFGIEKTRVKQTYGDSSLSQAQVETTAYEEIKEVYRDLKFEAFHEDHPYTHTPLVTSIGGRIASTGAPQGSLIAKLNKYDGDGAGANWWIPNMLRAMSDGDIISADTVNAESDYMTHVFLQQLGDTKVVVDMELVPRNIISPLNVIGVLFDHVLFKTKEVPVMISTSVTDVPAIREKMKEDHHLMGPAKDISEVIGEMVESMKTNRDKALVITTGDKAPDPEVALYIMKRFGFNKVLVETPSYIHYLAPQGMVDELFFSYSRIYMGGWALTIGRFGQEFDSKDHPHIRALSIHSHSDHPFYFRHKLTYG